MMIIARYALIVAALALATLSTADDRRARTAQQDLIGAWRLVDIEVDGPGGREVDPFYGSGSRGLLVYDSSGWFSVQIEGAGRPALQVPSARPTPDESESTARLKAAVLDSYYAYYGTWSFDAATSTVTHHAKGALYPGEDMVSYPQHVEVVGRRMSFSRTQNLAGKVSVQIKRWERVGAD